MRGHNDNNSGIMLLYNDYNNKDNMQVPKRKSEEGKVRQRDNHITQIKYDKIKAELKQLKKRVPIQASEVQRLAEMGDFSENAAYQMAKGKLRGMNRRVLELDDQLKYAIIIKSSDDGTVQLGSQVTVEMNGIIKEFTILGSSEIDVTKGVISHNSPIGTALVGAKIDDEVVVKLPDREFKCKIKAIR